QAEARAIALLDAAHELSIERGEQAIHGELVEFLLHSWVGKQCRILYSQDCYGHTLAFTRARQLAAAIAEQRDRNAQHQSADPAHCYRITLTESVSSNDRSKRGRGAKCTT